MTLEVSENGVAMRVILLEFHGSNFDQDFELIADENITSDRNIAVISSVLESDLGLNMGNEGGTSKERRRLVLPVKPCHRLQDADSSVMLQVNTVVGSSVVLKVFS